MRILFVCSGNSKKGISPLILNQGESLRKLGLHIDYFLIKGKGFSGYLSNIPALRNYYKKANYYCAHAHYSLIGIIASLAGCKSLIVSLMGSDIYEFKWLYFLTRIFSRFIWTATIVKSERMKSYIRLQKSIVIPNGIDLSKFKPLPYEYYSSLIPQIKIPLVIFIGNPKRREKNFKLAKEAMNKVHEPAHEFLILNDINNKYIPSYMNAASALLLTSLWEGSPNVIKEAMACNLPIVSVDVGDVKEIIGDTEGCHITSYNSNEIADKIKLVLKNNKRTNGREKIKYLASDKIARKLVNIYESYH